MRIPVLVVFVVTTLALVLILILACVQILVLVECTSPYRYLVVLGLVLMVAQAGPS